MDEAERLAGELARAGVTQVRRGEPLSRHCTWKIGGPADLLVEPAGREQTQRAIAILRAGRLPWLTIGSGSNLLFDSRGLRAGVLKLGRSLSAVRVNGAGVRAEAGVQVCRLARGVGRLGLSGVEHAVGIPGTLGGLVAMNGGSRRQCIGDCITSVTVITEQATVKTFPQDQCGFSYRHSRFQDRRDVIVEAELELKPAPAEDIRRLLLEVLRDRRAKFPRRQPNCGSVFLSDPEMYEKFGSPGKVIEQTGCKGWRVGGAEVSRKHANFIVNIGGATSDDVLALIARVRRAVHDRTGLRLACEVRCVSPDGRISPADQAGVPAP